MLKRKRIHEINLLKVVLIRGIQRDLFVNIPRNIKKERERERERQGQYHSRGQEKHPTTAT